MKKVFITGGTTGIGLALVKYYLKEGCKVGLCGRDLEKCKDVFDENASLSLYEVDVRNREKLKESILDFGQEGLDIVVANAGIGSGQKSKIPHFQKVLNLRFALLSILYNNWTDGIDNDDDNSDINATTSALEQRWSPLHTGWFCSKHSIVHQAELPWDDKNISRTPTPVTTSAKPAEFCFGHQLGCAKKAISCKRKRGFNPNIA